MVLKVVAMPEGRCSWVALLVDLYVKGKAVPILIKAPCHEYVWGSGDIANFFLLSALDGGEWSLHTQSTLPPEKNSTVSIG
jgi:hypothetical protein